MKYVSILLLFIPLFVVGQNEKNYLAGAVSEVDGKVVFSKEIQMPGFSEQQIYDLLREWVVQKYPDQKNRLVFEDQENGDLAAIGEDYLVFTNKALVLDRSLMNYRLTVNCEKELCQLSTSGIRYAYDVSYQKDPERYSAETWITDKYALTNKGKLARNNGKFRKATVDYMDELFQDVVAFLIDKTTVKKEDPSTPASNNVIIIPAQPTSEN